jgi:hypothetical protein
MGNTIQVPRAFALRAIKRYREHLTRERTARRQQWLSRYMHPRWYWPFSTTLERAEAAYERSWARKRIDYDWEEGIKHSAALDVATQLSDGRVCITVHGADPCLKVLLYGVDGHPSTRVADPPQQATA